MPVRLTLFVRCRWERGSSTIAASSGHCLTLAIAVMLLTRCVRLCAAAAARRTWIAAPANFYASCANYERGGSLHADANHLAVADADNQAGRDGNQRIGIRYLLALRTYRHAAALDQS